MLRVDEYLFRRFDLSTYNCWDLARDVWLELTGQDLGHRTPESITRAALLGRFERDVPSFSELPAPEDPCLVLMTRRGAIPHVGVFYRGRVLQLTASGASYMAPAVASAGFERVRYFR